MSFYFGLKTEEEAKEKFEGACSINCTVRRQSQSRRYETYRDTKLIPSRRQTRDRGAAKEKGSAPLAYVSSQVRNLSRHTGQDLLQNNIAQLEPKGRQFH
jgi:hypothetical protein